MLAPRQGGPMADCREMLVLVNPTPGGGPAMAHCRPSGQAVLHLCRALDPKGRAKPPPWRVRPRRSVCAEFSPLVETARPRKSPTACPTPRSPWRPCPWARATASRASRDGCAGCGSFWPGLLLAARGQSMWARSTDGVTSWSQGRVLTPVWPMRCALWRLRAAFRGPIWRPPFAKPPLSGAGPHPAARRPPWPCCRNPC